MEVMLICIVLFMKGIQGYFSKSLSGHLEKRTTYISYLSLNMFLSAGFAFIAMIIMKDTFIVNSQTLWYALLCGVSIAICMLANLMALKEGAVVLVQVFAMAGILVPCISGVFLFDETITLIQCVGILGLIGATVLLMQYNSSLYGKITPKMIILLVATLVSNGTTMLAQKMFAYYQPNASVSMFSLLGFLIPAVVLLLAIPLIAKSDGEKPQKLSKKIVFIGIILALALFTISQLSTVVSKILPSVLVFPMVNGGGLILSTIIAQIFFSEKLTLKSICGLLIGLLSLILINSVN